MLKRLKYWIINRIGPFIVKYYEKDFMRLMELGITQQCLFIAKEVEKAKARGVSIEIQIDPTSLPMGITLYDLMKPDPINKPKFNIVDPDNDQT